MSNNEKVKELIDEMNEKMEGLGEEGEKEQGEVIDDEKEWGEAVDEEKEEGLPDDDVTVTRGEFRGVLAQIFDNINEISNYLMGDVNAMFQRFAYPNHIKIAALVALLEENDIVTREQVVEKAKELMAIAEKEAQEVDEDGNPVFRSGEEH